MKLQDLCELNADELEKIVNNQAALDAICMPAWIVTRPDMAAKVQQVEFKNIKPLSPEEIEKKRRVDMAKKLISMMK